VAPSPAKFVNVGSKWTLLLTLAVLAISRADTATAALVPCKAAGGGHYNCQFYMPGNGRSGGAPVQAATGSVVGYGHWQLWVPSQPENTSEQLVDNRSFRGRNVWGPPQNVDRSFRAGSGCA
jgi:hypothetical protein